MILGLSLIQFLVTGCYYDVEEVLYPPSGLCDSTNVTYTNYILPVIEANCYVCHEQAVGLGDVVLEPHQALQNYALDGSLYCSISHGDGCSAMPKNSPKLLSCQIEIIKKWIDEGALEN